MIGLLCGSPKAKSSTSICFIERLRTLLGPEQTVVVYPKESDMDILNNCDTIVVVYPLYVDALPSHLLQFLTEYETRMNGGPMRLYALSHCGFYEGHQCRPSVEMLKHFCTHAGIIYGGAIGLGAGMMLAANTLPQNAALPLTQAFNTLAQAVHSKLQMPEDLYVHIKFPRFLFILAGNFMWLGEAKKNGIKKRDLYSTK